MRITIALPFLNRTGGIAVAAEYGRRLQARGHAVALYAPIIPYRFNDTVLSSTGLRRLLGDLRLNLQRGVCVDWNNGSEGSVLSLYLVPRLAAPWMPTADGVIATAWPTAYDVAALPARCGVGVYLVQHHETWSGSQARVDGSYRLPLKRIVVSSWLRSLLEDEFGVSVLATVSNGVDVELFCPAPEAQLNTGVVEKPLVLMQYSHLLWKGMSDGFAAWRLVRERFPSARLTLFGMTDGPDIPPEATFIRSPSRIALRDLYRRADIFVSPSWVEGFNLPPMEAMASGCAVVATAVGGVPDYTLPGETAYVVPPRNSGLLAAAMISLLQNPTERRRLAAAGRRHMLQFTWERSTNQFEQAIETAISDRPQHPETRAVAVS